MRINKKELLLPTLIVNKSFYLGLSIKSNNFCCFLSHYETRENAEYKFIISMSEQLKSQEQFLAEFNWHNFEEGIDAVDEKNLQEFEQLVSETFIDTDQEEVVEGVVVRITDRDVIVDINAKSEGVISLNEFRYNSALKVGDKVEVLIDIREDKTGQLVLSHRKARTIKSWDRVISANETGEIVTGFVKCRTKGGMIVDVFGIEAFLPGSQIDVKPIRDYDQYVNKTMEFKVVKINHEFKNVVAIKEAAGDIVQAMSIIKDKPKDFHVISGDDMITLPMVLAGGAGVISVIGEGFPKEFSEMVRLGLNKKVDESTILNQASIFNGAGRIYAPRYRQAHYFAFVTPFKEDKEAALNLAYNDVKKAFEYYLAHYNQKRPLIIASHSQGTVHATRLMKEYFDGKPLGKQLVAAYVVGMALNPASFSNLKACSKPTETGCVCAWRTFEKGYVPPFVEKEKFNSIVTNPLSWSDDKPVVERKANIYYRLAPTMEWDTAASHTILKNLNYNIYKEDENSEIEYNKKNLLNPNFISF